MPHEHTIATQLLCTPVNTSELLHIIFSFSDKRSNATNLRVCRQWYDVCKPLYWRNLESQWDFDPLLELLFNRLDHEGCPTRHPQESQWERFLHHASFVRSVSFDQTYVSFTAWATVLMLRPHTHLFPGLVSFEYKPTTLSINSSSGILFMQPTITRFVLHLPPGEGDGCLKTFYLSIIHCIPRMSSIVDLEIGYDYPSLVPDLPGIIRQLRQLETLILPTHHMHNDLIQVLSQLPKLRKITSNERTTTESSEDSLDESMLQDVPQFSPSLEVGAFPVLETLLVTGDIPSLLAFINSHTFPVHIHGFHVELIKPELSHQLSSLIRTITTRLGRIESLSIEDLDEDHAEEFMSGQWRPSVRVLEPVFGLSTLTSLKLRLKFPLNWTDDDTAVLARALPAIEDLTLNEDPLAIENPGPLDMTFGILRSFAEFCVKLRRLGVYCRGNLAEPKGRELHSFQASEELHVGCSPLPKNEHDQHIVAILLAQVLPTTCEIHHRWHKSAQWNKTLEALSLLRKMTRFLIQTA